MNLRYIPARLMQPTSYKTEPPLTWREDLYRKRKYVNLTVWATNKAHIPIGSGSKETSHDHSIRAWSNTNLNHMTDSAVLLQQKNKQKACL